MAITWNPGQHLWIGITGPELAPEERDLLKDLQPSGIVLFQRNCISADQVIDLIQSIQSLLQRPAIIAIDEEGGRVERLKGILPHRPPASTWPHHPEPFAEVVIETTRALQALGIHMNLTPVVDIARPDGWIALEDRCFGTDPDTVTDYARRYIFLVQGLNGFTCMKHFPGLGAGHEDTHRSQTRIGIPFEELWNVDLLPYRRLARHATAVMVAHAEYEALMTDLPASLNPEAYRILRQRLRFGGLALTDDLHMDAIALRWSPSEAARMAIQAGADILLIGHDPFAADLVAEHLRLARAHHALVAALERSRHRIERFFRIHVDQLNRSPSRSEFDRHRNRLMEALQRGGLNS